MTDYISGQNHAYDFLERQTCVCKRNPDISTLGSCFLINVYKQM